jgi:predicted nucleic acid-binding protein
MGTGYLLDSNVLIGFLAGKIPASGMARVSGIVDDIPHISVISQIEVLRFSDTPENDQILADFVSAAVIHPLGDSIVYRTIALCKQSKIKLPDAIIAATVFGGARDLDFEIEAAVDNEDGKTIGRSRIILNSGVMTLAAGNTISPAVGNNGTVYFTGVDANDLTDKLRIRITNIDGRNAVESGYVRVAASRPRYTQLTTWHSVWRIWNGDRQA